MNSLSLFIHIVTDRRGPEFEEIYTMKVVTHGFEIFSRKKCSKADKHKILLNRKVKRAQDNRPHAKKETYDLYC